MHAMLSITALHLGMACGGGGAGPGSDGARYMALVVEHKVRAIEAIRDNLNDAREATSDENIAAVFNLLCVEENLFRDQFFTRGAPGVGPGAGTGAGPASMVRHSVQPDNRQRLAHLYGLRDMIRMRAGLLGLWSSGTLQARTLVSFLIRYVAVDPANGCCPPPYAERLLT
jgi:hypothetical protein